MWGERGEGVEEEEGARVCVGEAEMRKERSQSFGLRQLFFSLRVYLLHSYVRKQKHEI